MHPLLAKILQKRGIKELKELQPDEKVVYDKWQGILSSGEITPEKIADFCRRQIEVIEKKWMDPLYERRDRLVDQHVVYKAILSAIVAPSTEKESLEKYLESLLT